MGIADACSKIEAQLTSGSDRAPLPANLLAQVAEACAQLDSTVLHLNEVLTP